MSVPSKRDIASEYIQSIVDGGAANQYKTQTRHNRHQQQHPEADEEEEFPVYQHRSEYSTEHDPSVVERAGGELVIDEKPDLDSVSVPRVFLIDL